MPLYRMNEGTFDMPETWHDRSVHVFTAGSGPPYEMSFVIAKDEMKNTTDLSEFAEQRLDQIESQLKQFTLIEKRQIELGGVLALEAEFRWRSEHGTMHQRQVFFPMGKKVLVITATAPLEIKPHQREQIDALLTSFQPTSS